MTFSEAFDKYLLDQKITGWGFQQPARVRLPNGYDAFPCGYYTRYENGYQLMISGDALGTTTVQEALILNPEGIPIARDTEDLRSN